MNKIFTKINHFKQSLSKRSFTILLLIATVNSLSYGQCPTTTCDTHTSILSTADFPECGGGTIDSSEDIDNNSDCEDSNDDNCWKFIIQQHDPSIIGITANIGKGNGCNGEVNTFYTTIDGVCENRGSSGSQNTFTFEFGIEGEITIWLCDGSSGQVSLCDLCGDALIPAPVELSGFAVKAKDSAVELNWQTASEENNQGFEIERSSNAQDWEVLNFIEGQGTIDFNHNYSFTDNKPLSGNNYYRLKQLDFNGQYEYSDVQTVLMDVDKKEFIKLYPNPSSGIFNLNFYNPNSKKAFIKLLDNKGELIWEEHFVNENIQTFWKKEFNLPIQGIYFMVTQVGDEIQTEKITILSKR